MNRRTALPRRTPTCTATPSTPRAPPCPRPAATPHTPAGACLYPTFTYLDACTILPTLRLRTATYAHCLPHLYAPHTHLPRHALHAPLKQSWRNVARRAARVNVATPPGCAFTNSACLPGARQPFTSPARRYLPAFTTQPLPPPPPPRLNVGCLEDYGGEPHGWDRQAGGGGRRRASLPGPWRVDRAPPVSGRVSGARDHH